MNWARLGIYHTQTQQDQVSTLDAIRTRQAWQAPGDHWLTWRYNDTDVCCWQRQHLILDGKNRLETLTWRQDHLEFTAHAIERLHQRGGNLQQYEWNLGHKDLAEYLRPLVKLALADEIIVGRSDLVLSWQSGAFVGDIVNSDEYFGVRAHRAGLLTRYEIVSTPPAEFLKFRAHTWIADSQMSDPQRSVVDLQRAGRMSLAAQAMDMMPITQYREVEIRRSQ